MKQCRIHDGVTKKVWHAERYCWNLQCENPYCPSKRPLPPRPATLSECVSTVLGTSDWIIIGKNKPTGHGKVDSYKLDDLEDGA